MSAIRIRPAGSTVSCPPCLPTHHFNVEKQHLRYEMLHHVRVVLAVEGWGAVGWYISLPALCCTSAPLSNPSISYGINFPPFPLLLSFHFLLSLFPHFQVMTLIGPREPDSSSPHPSSSKWKSSAQLFSSHSTHLFDSTMAQSFSNASLPTVTTLSFMPPPLPPSIFSSKLIIFVAPLFFHPPFVIFMFVDVHLSSFYLSTNLFSPYLSFHLHRWAPFLLLHISGSSMLIDLKAIISEKKSQRGFLSYQIWLVSFEHILSNNPSFPGCSHDFLAWWANLFRSHKHDFWII